MDLSIITKICIVSMMSMTRENQSAKKLLDIYKIDDLVWCNQNYTSIANALFKQISGYLPESQYNVQTRQIPNDFYPRAMQWCTDKKIPDDTLNIDICKCYPSILLNNKQPICVYTIHDTIEKYSCRSDLNQIGEFYLDETILYNFGTPIKLESEFYSSNLVWYLLSLNMYLILFLKLKLKN